MKKIFFIILGSIFITSCGEVFPNPEPSPPQPNYTESCSDTPDRAELENAEASALEIELACLIKNHPEQSRSTMSYHPLLAEVARMRAEDMAAYGFYGEPTPHVDRYGNGAQHYICLSGYQADFCPLIDSTSSAGEVIAAGFGSQLTPREVLTAWLNSPGHRRSVLAETENALERIYYGAGYAYTPLSPDHPDFPGHYWVFITARPPLDEEME